MRSYYFRPLISRKYSSQQSAINFSNPYSSIIVIIFCLFKFSSKSISGDVMDLKSPSIDFLGITDSSISEIHEKRSLLRSQPTINSKTNLITMLVENLQKEHGKGDYFKVRFHLNQYFNRY